ncbi:Ldh family oxidoreductase [uncultured Pelagimonas sp.]|uniref:Ldh family oxidoreductase n=1 Tax=uncultured Pelagimonas sp. TaxID=1618102 RepID=UPI00262E97D3|nr:Ldh family oxidoreductase [uncultured Pelagimonas sp.]
MPDIALSALERFCLDVLLGQGVPAEDAALIVDSIRFAHTHGKGTHGAGRMPIYVNRIQKGLMQAQTPLRELSSAPAMALLDAGDGFGQVAAIRGMDRAVKMAKTCGIGLVGIRHSHNFGTAAFVAARAVESGMAAIVLANAAPAIAPTGGHKAVFGTNPMAFGFPAPDGMAPVILDMATSQAARGKIRLAATNGDDIPLGWALDEAGEPTCDPVAALAGSMLPVGGAKGYGLSVVVDIMAGLMTRSASGGMARNLNNPDGPSRCGHMLIAIDIAQMMPQAEYDTGMRDLSAAAKDAGAEGAVFLPGERGAGYMQGRGDHVPLSDAVIAKLDALAQTTHVVPLERD